METFRVKRLPAVRVYMRAGWLTFFHFKETYVAHGVISWAKPCGRFFRGKWEQSHVENALGRR